MTLLSYTHGFLSSPVMPRVSVVQHMPTGQAWEQLEKEMHKACSSKRFPPGLAGREDTVTAPY